MQRAAPPKKLPRNYQVVYDVVSALGEGEHAAAGEIYAAARGRQAGIGYSTVYRALERLRDLGLVLEVRVPGSAGALYEAARASHAHFRCHRCGCVQDVDYSPAEAELVAVAQARRVAIDHVDVTFRGICETCRDGSPDRDRGLAGALPNGTAKPSMGQTGE